jgi:hypothetical protein
MCADVFGPVLDQTEGKRLNHHLSLLQYSFNLNIAIKKLISIEMTEITTEHDLHIIEQSTYPRSNVLLSQSIQRKSDIVMKSNSEKSGEEISRSNPLSELTVSEVGKLLVSIEFDEFKAVFAKNKIDGKCLMKCNTIEDVVSMGIPITVKASLLLDEIRKWKASSQDDDRNADVKPPIVSYVPLTITQIIVLYITLQSSMCYYTLIGW